MAGARAVAAQLVSAGHGIDVLTGGTDVHLVMCDLRASSLDGTQAADRLAAIGISVSCHPVPFDPRPPETPSGVRIGTSALATRGLQVEDFVDVGAIIAQALQPHGFNRHRTELAERVAEIADRYPLYSRIDTPALV